MCRGLLGNPLGTGYKWEQGRDGGSVLAVAKAVTSPENYACVTKFWFFEFQLLRDSRLCRHVNQLHF